MVAAMPRRRAVTRAISHAGSNGQCAAMAAQSPSTMPFSCWDKVAGSVFIKNKIGHRPTFVNLYFPIF
jgi:hypothetical protein